RITLLAESFGKHLRRTELVFDEEDPHLLLCSHRRILHRRVHRIFMNVLHTMLNAYSLLALSPSRAHTGVKRSRADDTAGPARAGAEQPGQHRSASDRRNGLE